MLGDIHPEGYGFYLAPITTPKTDLATAERCAFSIYLSSVGQVQLL